MKKVFFFSILIPLFISCQKTGNQNISTSQLLTSHKWKWFRVGNTVDDINITWDVVTESCEKDNWIDFSNGIVVQDEGATKCNPNDPQTVWSAIAWHLNSDNTEIILTGGAYLKILNLTANSLTVIEEDGSGNHDCYDWIPY
jgi:hypothetical protein